MQGNLFSGLNLSQEDKVLKYLLENTYINNNICKEKLGNFQLSFIIRKLLLKGIKIQKLQKLEKTEIGSKFYVNYVLAPFEQQNITTKSLMTRYFNNAKEA